MGYSTRYGKALVNHALIKKGLSECPLLGSKRQKSKTFAAPSRRCTSQETHLRLALTDVLQVFDGKMPLTTVIRTEVRALSVVKPHPPSAP
ncbi:hypothetical protein [Absidia glauca]|uniref:Uncharacterized protein n=1 Tax=Absidia glauca TaxID=4829 RepID=A0A168NVV4_ABSGL|nr:hypothetical protein [Absidia glauca]